MEAFTDETNFTVWSSISNCLSKLSALFSHTELDKPLKNYGRKLFSNVARRLGWDAEEKESHLDTLLRSLVLNKMISFEDPETIKEAKSRYVKLFNKKMSINSFKNISLLLIKIIKVQIISTLKKS